MSTKLSKFAVAVAAGLLGLAAGQSAQAGSKVLGTTGWVASWDSSLDEVVNLSVDPGSNLVVEKFADFRSFDPIPIVFQQVDPKASATLAVAIDSEFVFNNTNSPWNAFQMQILSGVTGTGSIASFDPAATGIGGPGGFSINPFTEAVFSTDNRVLDLSGGTIGNVPPGNVWQPGVASGKLYINAVPTASGALRSFVLKEIPIAIPVPAAAWTGLSGLVGLGLFGAARKVRSLIA